MRALKVTLVVLLLLICTNAAWAAPSVWLGEQQLAFDTEPIIENGRVLVPLRGIAESAGFTVVWEAASKTVTISQASDSIILVIGSPTAWINGAEFSLEAPAQIQNGRTLVPLRLVGEALGMEVAWEEATQTVRLTAKVAAVEPLSYPGTWKLSSLQIAGVDYPPSQISTQITFYFQADGTGSADLISAAKTEQESFTWEETSSGLKLTDATGESRNLTVQENKLCLDYQLGANKATLIFTK